MAQKITSLQRVRGIGANFSAVLVREVLYRSFANRRQLASYVGVAPMPYQSGGMDRDRSISRAGNPRARTTLIQLAWLWLRYQPGSALATWFRERVGTLQGRTRRIAIVALARKSLIALWRYVKRDRLLLWWLRAAAFQVGCVLPGQRLVHEAFWCGAMPPRPYVR